MKALILWTSLAWLLLCPAILLADGPIQAASKWLTGQPPAPGPGSVDNRLIGAWEGRQLVQGKPVDNLLFFVEYKTDGTGRSRVTLKDGAASEFKFSWRAGASKGRLLNVEYKLPQTTYTGTLSFDNNDKFIAREAETLIVYTRLHLQPVAVP